MTIEAGRSRRLVPEELETQSTSQVALAAAVLDRVMIPVYKDTVIRTIACLVATALSALLWASSLDAHHSFAAEYDVNKPVTLKGTVTRVEWANPHVRFFLNVKDETGAVAEWQFTMGALNGLLRRGWTRSMLELDDTVTVDGYLARDGSRLANARIVTLSDGRKMSGGTMPDSSGQ